MNYLIVILAAIALGALYLSFCNYFLIKEIDNDFDFYVEDINKELERLQNDILYNLCRKNNLLENKVYALEIKLKSEYEKPKNVSVFEIELKYPNAYKHFISKRGFRKMEIVFEKDYDVKVVCHNGKKGMSFYYTWDEIKKLNA
jgi:hypothetical protein